MFVSYGRNISILALPYDLSGICRVCKTVRFVAIPFRVKNSTTLV